MSEMMSAAEQIAATRELSEMQADFNTALGLIRRQNVGQDEKVERIRKAYLRYRDRHDEIVTGLTGSPVSSDNGEPPSMNDILRADHQRRKTLGLVQVFLKPPALPEELRGRN